MALTHCNKSLRILPPDAIDPLAVTYNALGGVYASCGKIDRALSSWREAVRCLDVMSDVHRAGKTRFNIALALTESSRHRDAREYALAALHNYETIGDSAKDETENARLLLARIEKALAENTAS